MTKYVNDVYRAFIALGLVIDLDRESELDKRQEVKLKDIKITFQLSKYVYEC